MDITWFFIGLGTGVGVIFALVLLVGLYVYTQFQTRKKEAEALVNQMFSNPQFASLLAPKDPRGKTTSP